MWRIRSVVSCISLCFISLVLLFVFRVNRRQILMRHLRNYRGRPVFKARPKCWSNPVARGTVYIGYHPDLDEQTRDMIDSIQSQLECQKFRVFDSQREMPAEEPELKGMQDGLQDKEIIVLFVDIKYLQDIHSTLEFRMAFDLWWTNLEKHLILVCLEQRELMLQLKRVDSDIMCFMEMFADLCISYDFETALLEVTEHICNRIHVDN